MIVQTSIQKYILIALILLFGIVIAGYVYYQAYDVIIGPQISISFPENGSTMETSGIVIEGIAQNISHIHMNDQPIFLNEDGKFSEVILLSYGYNIITVRAQDRFGRETKKELQLVYK